MILGSIDYHPCLSTIQEWDRKWNDDLLPIVNDASKVQTIKDDDGNDDIIETINIKERKNRRYSIIVTTKIISGSRFKR